MDDSEVAACVAAVVGHSGAGARVQPLGGRQGLLICRVELPGAGSHVFKVVRESLSRELELSALISGACPSAVPEVLHYEKDTKRGLYWMVARDLGPRRLSDSPSADAYVGAAHALARLQMSLIDRLSDLLLLGVPNVDLGRWEDVALAVVSRAQESRCQVIAAERAEIEQIAWSVDEVVADTLALPAALVHGDLHAGNIALLQPEDGSEPRVCLMDWGSAYVGAAFLAIEELLWPAAAHLRSPSDRDRVRTAYLRAWAPLLGRTSALERARLACGVLVRLELLHEALSSGQSEDSFAPAAAARHLKDAWRAWRRISA